MEAGDRHLRTWESRLKLAFLLTARELVGACRGWHDQRPSEGRVWPEWAKGLGGKRLEARDRPWGSLRRVL